MSKKDLPHEAASPSRRYLSYKNPREIVKDPHLNHNQKQVLLEEWKLDSERLLDSQGEGMLGGEHNILPEVEEALRQLEDKTRQ